MSRYRPPRYMNDDFWYTALETYKKPFTRWLRKNYPDTEFTITDYWQMFKNWFNVQRRSDTRIPQEEFDAGL